MKKGIEAREAVQIISRRRCVILDWRLLVVLGLIGPGSDVREGRESLPVTVSIRG